MPGKIAVLPETLNHRIAAGEVVERPASIIKELLENALDAGATEIVVDLQKGGCQAIRINDNGEGIQGDQVPLAFTRYATSKIETFDDLYRIRSFGFRGEALPSIASIARVEMVTRRASSPVGTRVVIDGGEVRELTDAGAPVGTSILIDQIFAPVPVRKKFLKSDMTEQGYCLDAITRLALAQQGVRIKVTAGERQLLNVPAVKDLAERIALTLGRDLRNQLVPVSGEKEGATLTGFASLPEYTRSGASQMYLYVNGRYVKDYLLNHAVMTAYRRIIEARRYPTVVLYLEMPPGDLDINVHPTKMEVRFRNPREVYALISESVSRAIGAGVPSERKEPAACLAVAGGETYASRVEEGLKRYRVAGGQEKLFFGGVSLPKKETGFVPPSPFDPPSYAARGAELEPQKETQTDTIPDACQGTNPDANQGKYPGVNQEGSQENKAVTNQEEGRYYSNLSYLGQVAATYLVFSGDEGVVLVDQHAAHERVLFEKLKKQSAQAGERSLGQSLLLPEVVSLSPREFAFLKEATPILEETGMEVEPFGGDSIVVKALPTFLPHLDAKELIRDIIEDCGEGEKALALNERREKLFTLLACRGAVKAHRRLSVPEVDALCRDLDAIHGQTCPHGRPVRVSIPVFDLERMFKRR